MCGRYALDAPHAQLAWRFQLAECPALPARFNIAPGTGIAVVGLSAIGERKLELLRWGLVPHWARDPAIGARLINARGESLTEKPSFRDAFRRRRCLIPASGFYEWQRVPGKGSLEVRQPYYVSLTSGETMAFAGLWESWTSPGGEVVRSCCIVTAPANELMRPIHDRMPLILAPDDWQRWLAAPADQAALLIRPGRDAALQLWPVARRIGRVSEDDPGLIEPLDDLRR